MLAELHGRQEIVDRKNNPIFTIWRNEQNENYPPHWHTDLEIIMPTENTYTVIVRDETYVLEPGDIMLIPSGELHEIRCPDSGSRYILQIDNAILREVNGYDSIHNKFYPCALFKKSESIDGHDTLAFILRTIVKEYAEKLPLFEASIHAYIITFLVKAGRIRFSQVDSLNEAKAEKQQYYIDVFYNICTYMNEHCTDDLAVDDLAAMAGFSTSHFIRLFKKFTGVTYYDYLTKRKINLAEILLLDKTDLSISDVAMNSGFNSLATFNRVFKQAHGCTPTEYRSMYIS